MRYGKVVCGMVGAVAKINNAFFPGLGLPLQKWFQIDCGSLHLLKTDALVGDTLVLKSSQICRMWTNSFWGHQYLSSFSFPRAEGMESWWAPFLVVRTHLTGMESWRVAPIGPPDHAALIGCCPRFSRSPKPLHSHVHCPRGSHHHSGEWYGGGAACACKFPQAVFSSQWVMDLFSLFEALEQLLTHCPEPVGNILIPVLPWLQYCPPAAPLLPYLEMNLILLF